MALPIDFWKNDHNLNIFRTKFCARLGSDGRCEWKSQCQYSHCAGWPRRPPLRHKYSPEICPNIQKIQSSFGAPMQITNRCTQGFKCQFAHSKEEMLFHPQMFKTILCEEYELADRKRNNKRGKKCHRYYCPFAHGEQELQTSTITFDQRQLILTGLDLFPSDQCCNACALSENMPPFPQQSSTIPAQRRTPKALENMPPFPQQSGTITAQRRMPTVEALENMLPFPQQSGSAWPFSPLSRPMPPYTQADLVQEQLRRSLPMLPSSAFGHNPFPFPRGRVVDRVNNANSFAHKVNDDKWKSLGSPAFVNICDDGFAPVGAWDTPSDLPAPKWMKDAEFGNATDCNIGFESLQSQELLIPKTLEEAILKELVYTML